MDKLKFGKVKQDVFAGRPWKATEWYLDDWMLELVVSPIQVRNQEAQLHIIVRQKEKVVTFGEWNRTMPEARREQYVGHLHRQIAEALTEEAAATEVRLIAAYAEQKPEKLSDVPFHFVFSAKPVELSDAGGRARLEKRLYMIFSEWLEEVFRDTSAAAQPTLGRSATAVLDVELLKHETNDSSVHAIVTALAFGCLVLSYFYREYFILQMIALALGGCTAYRSYQQKKFVLMGICLVIAAAGLALAVVAYREMGSMMQGAMQQKGL